MKEKVTALIIILLIASLAVNIVMIGDNKNKTNEIKELKKEVNNSKKDYEKFVKSISNSNNEKEENEPIIEEKESNTTDEEKIEYENTDYIEKISYTSYKEKLNKKENFLLVFVQTGCGHCESFIPIFSKIVKDNNITAYQLDLLDLTAIEREELDNMVEIPGTPTTINFINGAVDKNHEAFIGNRPQEELIKFLTNLGVMN